MGGVKQTLGQQLCLEFFKGGLQRAGPGWLHMFDNQLEFTAPFVQRYPAAQLDSIAILRRNAHPLIAIAKHRAAHLGGTVLEREVPVAGGGTDKITDLPLYPDEAEVAFQQRFGLSVELADA